MFVSRKKQRVLHRTVSIAVVLAYFFISVAVDLFHSEACEKSGTNTVGADGILDNSPCLACSFNAGSNSAQPECQLALSVLGVDVFSQPAPCPTYAPQVRLTTCILLRAPPSEIIS